METSTGREPIINAPGIVLALLALLILVHGVLVLMPPITAEKWLLALAFIPARYGEGGALLPGGEASLFISPVSHMLLHGDWVHLGFNCAWLLAFGAIIARRMNAVRFILLTVICGLGGAGLFWLANPYLPVPMVGASGAVSGLMGAVFRFLFNAPRYGGFGVLREMPRAVPAMSIPEALRTPGVLVALTIWLGVNLLFATDFAKIITDGEIAWEAHVGGFLTGFLLLGLFDQPFQPPAEDERDDIFLN